MEKLVIEGGKKLQGEVKISGAKNAVLPIMAATLLTDETCTIHNVPKLRDTMTMAKLLRSLGKNVDIEKDCVTVSSKGEISYLADYKLVSTMRGSFCVLGPLLAKLGIAKVSLPGGCIIGVRPVDLHIKGIQALGAKIHFEGGYVIAQSKKLQGTHIYLGGVSGSSVLATANVMMAATLAAGETIIESAACEPEVEDLANFLIEMGARIKGHGSPQIVISGVKKLHGADYKVIPDRIEAGTFILMAAAMRSNIVLRDVRYNHLSALVDKLEEAGVKVIKEHNMIRVKTNKTIKPVSVTMLPYPGFPTDLQAQFMAVMAMTPGISVITDKIYPDRFMHIAELNRMGADIRREGSSAIVQGTKAIYGAPVMASDLRASAALLIAGLAAEGTTEIHRIYHLDRGYEAIDEKLAKLGAKVSREKE
ncbi:MAG TPA: UDP-N-acetylglucosamine 1-carboxyvinyltransferase [Candidatus Omnitrophota bacterium]|nr:UDP-N-acetylglucosamine 1-carboxyvinyltransferase [Candidatus Omnitrophota bacterium]HPD85037.1 UDP-N-acetylglucosamine 1-carboxyvinyltransferase [Candidatus Omnitrophota bacterium]HRZ03895.1 UDP-N-acetylglucosamine 1-carboxyvinyltransferase [Candidatus Omnitrophota bacterium]